MTTRVRFAPAPTGYLHVGSARSALFNWLFARSTGGTMILRIEDTDAALKTEEFVQAILGPLAELGIDWDEGPFFQSERRQLHVDAVNKLVADGNAYFCNLTRDQADALADEAGLPRGYHGWSRDSELEDGDDCVVRFKTPDEGQVVIEDAIRGTVTFNCADLEDFVIRRSDGSPTFLVANAVDDADMNMTHVIRGEDLLNTTPKVVLIWEALGLGERPTYAHLPLLVNDKRKKLSKRRDDVSLSDFMADGFLPEAMVNHLALLGWGPADEVEIRPLSEIIELFRLEDITKGSAFFDVDKLAHINGEYIRALSESDFIAKATPFVNGDHEVPWATDQFNEATFALVAGEVQQRVKKFSESPDFVDWIFAETIEYDERSWTKAMKKGKQVPEILEGLINSFADVEWTGEALNAAVFAVGETLGVRSQVPARVAITGRNSGIPMWDAVATIDREVVLARLRNAQELLVAS